MKKTYLLLVAFVLCLPIKTFALDVVDVTWEDTSYGVNSAEGSYGGQELYAFKDKIFLAQYLHPYDTAEVDFKYDFSLLDNKAEWNTLIRYYKYSNITGSSSTLNDQLVFQLDFDIYSVNKKGVITPLGQCDTWHGKIMKYKKFIYIGCYKDLYRYNGQNTQTLQNSFTNNTTFFENQVLLTLTFNKKLYLFSTDANDETVIYSRNSNDGKWKI
ncbi:MAG TPA: hypothetical protein DEG44_00135, partial [Candidatus Kerfeldbacteria bacterium]|nr:hypothetical protein [Candidatus Kerfeldbacteria bacterium]